MMKLDDIETPALEQAAVAELLTALVEHYESKTVQIPHNTLQESLASLMEDRGLRHKDIAAIVGNKGLTTEAAGKWPAFLQLALASRIRCRSRQRYRDGSQAARTMQTPLR